MKDVKYNQELPLVLENLAGHGIFLTAGREKTNAMTIGWGSVGFYWGKPMFVVPVRQSRHTHDLIQAEGTFTVSVPAKDTMNEELLFCGTKSGRDVDKFAVLNLQKLPGRAQPVPVIGACPLHYECRVVMAQDMQPGLLESGLEQKCYGAGDYHTLYYGEILSCYRTDE